MRVRLLRAVREVVARRGVDAATIADFTEAADVAKGTFYNHFGSKGDALEAALDEALEGFARPMRELAARIEDPAEGAAVTLRHALRLASGDAGLGRFLLAARPALEARLLPWVRDAVARGIASGRFHCADRDLAAALLLGELEGVVRARLAGRIGDGVGVEVAAHALRALGLPEAEARAVARRPLPPRWSPARAAEEASATR